ncbi:MAG: Ig-like domain-containing protein [Actinomycetota bacterium]|nr:Ig-like domain-containing protein [Actinomycetota bacterium]
MHAPQRAGALSPGRVLLAGALLLALAASGCTVTRNGTTADAQGSSSHHQSPTAASAGQSLARITANIRRGATGVRVDRRYHLSVTQGSFRQVTVSSGKSPLGGALSADRRGWTSSQPLEPGRTYAVRSVVVDDHGVPTAYRATFATQKLALSQQIFPSFAPVGGQTVGIGMPVIIKFDVAVTNRAAIQKHLSVVSTPSQAGAFHWVSDNEVHWRPVRYWKPGTKVRVKAAIDSVAAGHGIYGQLDREISFNVGRAMVDKVNIATHQLRVFENGRLIKTIPVTAGGPGFATRSGVKVIVEKFRKIDMNSGTIGIDPNSPSGYNLKNVEYAMRLTYSGEFLHAAPWSVASQGIANVSHGCTGMSTANAQWLFDHSIVGDPVEYTGSNRWMTLTNGFGDWNEPFAQYRQASALS